MHTLFERKTLLREVGCPEKEIKQLSSLQQELALLLDPEYLLATEKHTIDTDNSPFPLGENIKHPYLERIRQLAWFNHPLHLVYMQLSVDPDIPTFRWGLMKKYLGHIDELNEKQLVALAVCHQNPLVARHFKPHVWQMLMDFPDLGLYDDLVLEHPWLNKKNYSAVFSLVVHHVMREVPFSLYFIRHLEQVLEPRLHLSHGEYVLRQKERIKNKTPTYAMTDSTLTEYTGFNSQFFEGAASQLDAITASPTVNSLIK